jgi:predicted O-methyltransferase YrrM
LLHSFLSASKTEMSLLLESYTKKYLASGIKATEGFMSGPQAEWCVGFLQKHPEIKKIVEIGFNGGFSSGVFLTVRSDIEIVSVDIGLHDYVLPAKAWIDSQFKGRHTLIIGDSRDVLPKIPHYLKEADLIFIDGGHDKDIPDRDIHNTLLHCRPDAHILIDDYIGFAPVVVNAVNSYLKSHRLHGIQVAEGGDRGWILCKKVC